ncbi:MAG: ABC transporter permease [Solirubrobacterales bacterium]|nr:ABC transporter permease [Solirubrobacterales bacterium]
MRTLAVIGELGRRSVRQTFRRPQLMAPLLIIPTLLLAVQSAGAGRAVDLPGFPPVESFFDFLLAGAMVQAALLAGNSGGIAMAIDIEMGFTDRLLAAPIPRFAIVAGRLAGTAAVGAVIAVWFLVIGVVFGATIEEGIPGALMMIVLVVLAALAFGTLGAALALRTGSASVVQGTFPLVFVILFLSTAFFPADLLLEPAETIARVNPLSFVVTAVRDPVISAWSAGELAAGFAATLLIGAVGIWLCSMALRRRLRMG